LRGYADRHGVLPDAARSDAASAMNLPALGKPDSPNPWTRNHWVAVTP